ncbi:MAG: hypothetical protein HOJ35_11880 [Bdellovibrionales bacterium]|jgi:endonuclease/exonuclease/phosphatase family metal-dependent hydrolase|nr:hypothetical protein [Bdellovibrionales bacterium]
MATIQKTVITVIICIFCINIQNANSKQFVLKVMNYNVKGVPVFWYWHFRHKYIGHHLVTLKESGKGADIIALQEMMSRRTRKIHKITKYPNRDQGPKGKWFRTSSGLEILSEYPFLETSHDIVFNKCKNSDCLSRKGVQHVKIHIPGLPFPIDFYNTHLNAGGIENTEIRYSQIKQLNSFIEKTRTPNIPMIITGDFNFKQAQKEYPVFTSKYNPENAAYKCGISQSCEGHPNPYEIWLHHLIDHQFYHPGSNNKITITPIYYDHYFTDIKVGKYMKVELSDHPAVMVHYLIDY